MMALVVEGTSGGIFHDMLIHDFDMSVISLGILFYFYNCINHKEPIKIIFL